MEEFLQFSHWSNKIQTRSMLRPSTALSSGGIMLNSKVLRGDNGDEGEASSLIWVVGVCGKTSPLRGSNHAPVNSGFGMSSP
jgi:hypothetical protein